MHIHKHLILSQLLYRSIFPQFVDIDAISQVKEKMENESVEKKDNGLSRKRSECETQPGQMYKLVLVHLTY